MEALKIYHEEWVMFGELREHKLRAVLQRGLGNKQCPVLLECMVFEEDWEAVRMKKADWSQIVEAFKCQELHFRKMDGIREYKMN